MDSLYYLIFNCLLSIAAAVITLTTIPKFEPIFKKAGLKGNDMGNNKKEEIAESMGMIAGTVYVAVMFLFIPVPFLDDFSSNTFDYHEFVSFLSALLSICCMLLLGFADDVLNLRWRYKLLLPTFASVPLLMVYLVVFNRTHVVLPKPVRFIFGRIVELGPLYYAYMAMMAVFCTNSINILAGINGLEVGQSVVVATSLIIFNFVEYGPSHIFCLYILMPFLGVSLGLLFHNWFPASVFVGDTYCYFAGMTFAVVGILGHCSKTLLLFFIPQILNFLYSCPQLFRLLPCPRHRLPAYDPARGRRSPSTISFRPASLSVAGRLLFHLIRHLRLADVNLVEDRPANPDFGSGDVGGDGGSKDGLSVVDAGRQPTYSMSNLTLINWLLYVLGPMTEANLTLIMLILHALCSCCAFAIRFPLAQYIYD